MRVAKADLEKRVEEWFRSSEMGLKRGLQPFKCKGE